MIWDFGHFIDIIDFVQKQYIKSLQLILHHEHFSTDRYFSTYVFSREQDHIYIYIYIYMQIYWKGKNKMFRDWFYLYEYLPTYNVMFFKTLITSHQFETERYQQLF